MTKPMRGGESTEQSGRATHRALRGSDCIKSSTHVMIVYFKIGTRLDRLKGYLGSPRNSRKHSGCLESANPACVLLHGRPFLKREWPTSCMPLTSNRSVLYVTLRQRTREMIWKVSFTTMLGSSACVIRGIDSYPLLEQRTNIMTITQTRR